MSAQEDDFGLAFMQEISRYVDNWATENEKFERQTELVNWEADYPNASPEEAQKIQDYLDLVTDEVPPQARRG